MGSDEVGLARGGPKGNKFSYTVWECDHNLYALKKPCLNIAILLLYMMLLRSWFDGFKYFFSKPEIKVFINL